MAKKLKETDRHTDGRTYGLPLVVLSAALQQKRINAKKEFIKEKRMCTVCPRSSDPLYIT